MSSVRGNSKSSARRLRLNLAEANYSEMMEWNTTEILQNNLVENCYTPMEEENTNSAVDGMSSINVSVYNTCTTETYPQCEGTENIVVPCLHDEALKQQNEGLQVPCEFEMMLSMDSNFGEEDQCQNVKENDLIDWSTNDFGESEDDEGNDILVILVISMMK
ncbi:hypothetical protein GHT06_006257 [Daphnia sinensis]|uniref:Uncharacterized protein n=1 Tax=Daphnia sinensis TaxID=1820382 RepID=A0AAD5L4U1_9CRUS|nr:hypothetical protein GHT06_006257 [Daphnia sinensis]